MEGLIWFDGQVYEPAEGLDTLMMTKEHETEGYRATAADGLGSGLFFAEVAFRGDTHRLARLLMDDLDERENWFRGELAAMLTHQLNVALGPDLGLSTPDSADATVGSTAPACTIRDAILGEAGSVERLRRIKEYAKALVQKDPSFPGEIARVMYYCSVVAARRRFGERISSLTDLECLAGVDWVINQDWIDSEIRDWFCSARGILADPA